MNLKFLNKELDQLVKKYQEGGEMPPAEGAEPAPAPEQGGGDPMEQIIIAFLLGLNNQDCLLLAQAAQAFLGMVGGQQASSELAPPNLEPVYKAGGKLIRYLKKF